MTGNGTEQVIRLSGWKANVLSGLVVAAISSGAVGLILAAKLTWGFDDYREGHEKDYAVMRAQVDRLWENDIRETVRREMQAKEDAEIAAKLDKILRRLEAGRKPGA